MTSVTETIDFVPQCMCIGRWIESRALDEGEMSESEMRGIFTSLLYSFEELKEEKDARKILSDQALFCYDGETLRASKAALEKAREYFDMDVIPPRYYLPDASNYEILKYAFDHEHWDDSLPCYVYNSEIDGDMAELISGDENSVIQYLEKEALSVEESLDLLESIHGLDILAFPYAVEGMVKLCRMFLKRKLPLKAGNSGEVGSLIKRRKTSETDYIVVD